MTEQWAVAGVRPTWTAMLLQELPTPSSSSDDSLFLLPPSRAQSAELPVTSPVVAQAQRALKQVRALPRTFPTRSANRRRALSCFVLGDPNTEALGAAAGAAAGVACALRVRLGALVPACPQPVCERAGS